jgi:hypothetical protein
MVAPAIILGLRGVQVLFSIIVLGLTAYRMFLETIRVSLANKLLVVDSYVWTPASVSFMLFTAIWTLLAVAYLVLAPTRFPRAAHKFAIAGVEALTMLFWFAAFVAVAARWGDAWWAGRRGTFYGSGVAAIVFAAFTW